MGRATTTTGSLDFPRFRTAVSESFVPLRVTTGRPDPFGGRIRHVAAGDVHCSIVSADEHLVERTPKLIADSPRRCYKVGLQLEGTGLLVQHGRETVLRPGSLVVYDTDHPYSLAFEERSSTFVLMFPAHALDLPHDAVGQLTATSLGDAGGLGDVVVPHLANLAGNLELVGGPGGDRLARTSVDLVAAMLSNELATARVSTSPRQRLFSEVTRYIDEHLRSTELDPGSLAAAHFVSPRHLHSLFHEHGATVSGWVRRRRLEECRRRLADPAFDHRSISSIASEWGFADAAHFSRVFRTEFDRSPSAIRGER